MQEIYKSDKGIKYHERFFSMNLKPEYYSLVHICEEKYTYTADLTVIFETIF